MSALSLEELQRLQKFSQKTKTISATQLITTPSTSSSEIAPVSVALQKKVITSRRGLDQFETSIGGRAALIEALEVATLDKKQEYFLNLLCDGKRGRDTLDTIARDAGMRPNQIIDLFRSASFARAHAIATAKMAAALPDVVDDIAAKSVDARIECPTCFGAKQISNVDCPNCLGKGEIMRFSDIDRQKILLESAGVTKRGQNAVNVNVNQQVGIVNPGSFFSGFVRGSDSAAYDVEGEVIE